VAAELNMILMDHKGTKAVKPKQLFRTYRHNNNSTLFSIITPLTFGDLVSVASALLMTIFNGYLRSELLISA
jgi:hypothetical protein